MLKTLSNIVEMVVYASVYLLISMVALKIVGAGFASGHDKPPSENSNSFLVVAALLIGIAIVISTVIR